MDNLAGQQNSDFLPYKEEITMKQLIIAILLLIVASITLSAASYQINAITTKNQQIEVLKEMLKESNDREREYLKALGITLEDIEKEND